MDGLKKKVGYLKGLAEGITFDEKSKEGKLFKAIIDVLDEMAMTIEEVALNQVEIENYLDAFDEDLGDLEDVIFGEEGEFIFDEEEEFEEDEEDEEKEDQNEDEGTEEELELACPYCLSVLDLEPNILEDEDVLEIICPNCDKTIYVNDNQLEMKKEGEAEKEQSN
ncbi:MAG: CD1247 N-terminal domain-containing protein [Peptococcia bacterium]|jgi:DNA-directed RNA polymerase subunit delta